MKASLPYPSGLFTIFSVIFLLVANPLFAKGYLTTSAPSETTSNKLTGDQKNAKNTTSQQVYTWEDNKGVAFVKKDSPLIIELAHSGSTGYRWVIHQVNSSFLKVREILSIDKTSERNEGSYPVEKFTFQASKLGTTKLRLLYSRSEDGSNSTLRYELEVRILNSQKEVNKARRKYLRENIDRTKYIELD